MLGSLHVALGTAPKSCDQLAQPVQLVGDGVFGAEVVTEEAIRTNRLLLPIDSPLPVFRTYRTR